MFRCEKATNKEILLKGPRRREPDPTAGTRPCESGERGGVLDQRRELRDKTTHHEMAVFMTELPPVVIHLMLTAPGRHLLLFVHSGMPVETVE